MGRKTLKKISVQGIIIILASIMIFIFSGCGDEPEQQAEKSKESGRIALSITWKTQSADSDIQNPDGTLNCENSDVAFIYAAVYDSENRFLGDSGSQGWDCNEHSGVIEGIEAGEGRRIVILGKNLNNEVVFRGEQNNVTVTAGQTVKPEPVEAKIFSPKLTDPKSNLTVLNGEFNFRWLDVPGASTYEISISNTIDFRNISELQTISTTTYSPVTLGYGLVYYWRVRAVDSQGNAGAWSNTDSFYIQESRNSSPVLNAIGDRSVNEGETLEFLITASDPDNDSLSYSINSLPSGATFDTVTQKFTWTPTYSQAGQYDNIKFVVTDNGKPNISTSETITITVVNVNSPPTAYAGGDQSGVYGQTITLNGSGSSDVDGDSLTYSWSFTSRPSGSTATLSSSTAVNPSFKIDKSGNYTVRLIVNDGKVNSAPDTVSISTNNSAPVANAGPNQSGVYGQTITLNGSGSSDADGDSLIYSWSFISRPSGSTAILSSSTIVNPSFTIDQSGNYTVQLIVNDGKVNSAPDTVTISTSNSAPVANAGPDQSGVYGQTITLNGSGSSDVDGDSLTYSWSFISRPSGSTATLSSSTAVNPSFTIDKSGDYTVRLIVSDGNKSSTPDTVIISTSNSAPVANAGPDQSGVNGQTITMNGSGSSDVDGDPLTYSWSFTSRPSGSKATLSSSTAVNPSFKIDKSGNYTVQLTVNDGEVNSVPDTVTISTNNSAPVANAGADQSGTNGETITLNGSGSSDVDGDSLTYSWAFTSRPSGSTATLSSSTAVNPSFTIDKSGDYTVQLIVNDGEVNSAPDTVTISTNNSAPVANAGPDQSGVYGQTITLNGSGSSDVDGDSLTYSWAFTSRPSGSTATLSSSTAVNSSFTIDKSGNYTVRLIVNDGEVNSAPDTVTISTNNSAPVANAGPDQSGVYGQTITLNGSGSSDVDGDPLTYSWAFTSRPSGSTADLSSTTSVSPSFTIDVSGDYTVRLTVNDGTVNSAPDTVTISTENSAPIANAGPDQAGVNGESITLNGSGSSDVDGDPLTYSWAFTSRPSGSTAALSSATSVNPSFTIDKSGDYTVRLTVNDGTVNSAPDTVTISTENSAPIANAGPDQAGANGESITLNGSGSSDVDGDSLTYSWAFTSRPSGSTATLSSSTVVNPNFEIDVSGNYIVQLIVNDSEINSVPDTVTISTNNSAPVADAGPDQAVVNGDPVTLDGSGSVDADEDTLSYSWSLISQPDGSNAFLDNPNAISPVFTADLVGTYVIQLIVHDGAINSSPDSVMINAN